MGYYYPQAAMTLRILWEDFNFKSDASLQKTYELPVLTKDVTVNINDYSHADTFEAEIDYKNFPFEPRCIRALGVTIHLENRNEIFQGNNELSSLKPSVDNTIFQGFADTESIQFDDVTRTVRMEGRDFTSLLIDEPYNGGSVPLTDRVDKVIQNLLDQLKATKPITLEIRPASLVDDLPVLAALDNTTNKLNGRKNVDRNKNYWDVIQDIVARAGLIAYIELDKLVLTKPRVLYNPDAAKVFIYGRNIKNLHMKRKIGRKKDFNVIVRSLVDKQVIEAKIPLEGTKDWSDSTGIPLGEVKLPQLGPDGQEVPPDQWKPAPYIAFRIANCKDKDHLVKYAEELYEEIGRQQIEGSFETAEMETATLGKDHQPFTKDDSIFNILKLHVGTPIMVRVDQGDLQGMYGVRGKSDSETIATRARYLRDRGYDESVARAFASSFGKFADVFYTKGVKFTLNDNDGFKANIDFLNFIDTKLKPPA